jgi:hypothetical protein
MNRIAEIRKRLEKANSKAVGHTVFASLAMTHYPTDIKHLLDKLNEMKKVTEYYLSIEKSEWNGLMEVEKELCPEIGQRIEVLNALIASLGEREG